MDFNMTDSQKQAMLAGIQVSLESEIYTLLVRLGVDPDSFDENGEIPEVEGALFGEKNRLEQLIASLKRVREKFDQLS